MLWPLVDRSSVCQKSDKRQSIGRLYGTAWHATRRALIGPNGPDIYNAKVTSQLLSLTGEKKSTNRLRRYIHLNCAHLKR